MKKKLSFPLSLGLLFIFTSIAIARDPQKPNPFDAAIKQIDAQSKELNQNIISTQQEGLAHQKIQRLELELTTIKAAHLQEISSLQHQHEEQINAFKNEITKAQQAHDSCSSSLKVLKKEVEDARQELAQCRAHQATIDELKATIADLEEQLKAYKASQDHLSKSSEHLTPSSHPAVTI